MAIIDEVDVCVTCVTDKPPKLPLREELVSLGVEVILNAQGIGAKAVKHETRQKVKEFRKEYDAKTRSSLFCVPTWKSHKREMHDKQERKRAEKELKQKMQGLSYDKYNRILSGGSVFSSDSSWNTNSTGSTSEESEKQGGGNARRKMFAKRRNEQSHPDYLSDAAVASAFADSNAANLLKGSKGPKEELPTAIAFKPRRDKEKYDHGGDASRTALADDEPEETQSLGAYGFLSGNESISKYSQSGLYEKWDVSASKELADGDSSDGSLYTSDEASQQRSQQPPSTKLLAIKNGNGSEEEEESHQGTELESLLGIGDSPRKDASPNQAAAKHQYVEDLQDSDKDDSYVLDDGTASIDLPSLGTPSATCSLDASTTSETTSVVSPRKGKQYTNLLEALKKGCGPNAVDLHSFVDCDTNLVPQPGWTSPLHEACDEEFPDRLSSSHADILTVADELLHDILKRKERLTFVTNYLSHSCMMENRVGDLPVHLLVRRLIPWEASWQARVNAEMVESWTGVTKFTQLHKIMGECVDLVIKPMARNKLACQNRGRLGTRILPLHAAAMFAVPHDTLQVLLESYPGAASVSCNLGDLPTFIISEQLPLELLERQRSELPLTGASMDERDAVQGEGGDDGGIQWTKSALCSTNNADDLIRRSDMLFAFNPNILPYRKDAARLKRIELIVRAEASVTMSRERKTLDSTARAAWTWLCTSDELDEDEQNNITIVERIVNALEIPAVQFLASLGTPDGTILATATPECARVIQSRLDGNSNVGHVTSLAVPPRSSLKQGSQQSILKQGRGEAEAPYIVNDSIRKNALIREVFNIREQSMPTSFIFLPYELKRNKDDSLGLKSTDFAHVAVEFASCLTELTEPWHVNYILEKKAKDCLGHELAPKRVTAFQSMGWRSRSMVDRVKKLFEGKGFLYLLDEDTGAPIVHSSSEAHQVSPVMIYKPAEAIERLLPLLLIGMIKMRGDKANVIMIETILAGKRAPSKRWISIMQNIIRYVYSRRSKLGAITSDGKEIAALSDVISDFVSRTTKRNSARRPETEDGGEWAPEMSYLKVVLKGTPLLAAAKLPSVKLGTQPKARKEETDDSLKGAKDAISTHDLRTTEKEHKEDPPLTVGDDAFDMVWALGNEKSTNTKTEAISDQSDSSEPVESRCESLNGSQVSQDESRRSRLPIDMSLTAVKQEDQGSIGAKLPRFAKTKDDVESDTERNGERPTESRRICDISAKRDQVTASHCGSSTLLRRPPRTPKITLDQNDGEVDFSPPSIKITQETEEKLMAIKRRLRNLDRIGLTNEPDFAKDPSPPKKDTSPKSLDRIVFIEPMIDAKDPDLDSLLDDPLPSDYSMTSSNEKEDGGALDTRDDDSMDLLLSRLLGLEERIHNKEEEMVELRHDVSSFEMKAADAIYESLSRDQDIDSSCASSSKQSYGSSYTSTEGTTMSSFVSHEDGSHSSVVTIGSSITSKPSVKPNHRASFTFDKTLLTSVSSSSEDDEETSYSNEETADHSSYSSSCYDGSTAVPSSAQWTEDSGVVSREVAISREALKKSQAAMEVTLLRSWHHTTPEAPFTPTKSGSVEPRDSPNSPGNPFAPEAPLSPSKRSGPDSPNNPFSSASVADYPVDSPKNPFAPSNSSLSPTAVANPFNPFNSDSDLELDVFHTKSGRDLPEV